MKILKAELCSPFTLYCLVRVVSVLLCCEKEENKECVLILFFCSIGGTIECPPLPPIANGVITGSQTGVGATVTYSCNTGFQLVGDPTRMCQPDSTWSSAPPVCLGE